MTESPENDTYRAYLQRCTPEEAAELRAITIARVADIVAKYGKNSLEAMLARITAEDVV